MDAIVQSRLATEKAKQDAEKAKQEAIAQQAVEEGRIRVEQSKLQEEARQQAILQEYQAPAVGSRTCRDRAGKN